MSNNLFGLKKTPQTKLGAALRKVAVELRAEGDDGKAHQAENAAATLDKTALVLGAKGPRVYTLGAYVSAVQLYKYLTGKYPEGAKRFVSATGELVPYEG